MEKCEDCVAGMIAGEVVHVSQWTSKVKEFEKVIEQFNIDTRRKQVNHPGFINTAIHCLMCGNKL